MDEQIKIEFGTDGIRGIAGQYPLDPMTVQHIGRAIGTWLRARIRTHKPRTVIGHDTRISGHMLLHALASGLLAEGVDVMDATVMTTPGVSYLTRLSNFDLGVVISASHNPVEQNGIKLFGPDGFKIPDHDERAVEALIAELPKDQPSKVMGYFYRSMAAQEHYVNFLLNCFEDPNALRGLRVALDCANGAATPVAGDAFHKLGATAVIECNATPDGLNINVKAGSEHVRRNRSDLLEVIQSKGCDLGIAFDGDADRVVFLTPDGMLVDGDHILGILAAELKAQGRFGEPAVVATEMSNSGLEDFLNTNGIRLIRVKVGDRYVMQRIREDRLLLGGEQAGHVILLNEELTAGDGIYIGMLVASLVARNKRNNGPTLDELAARIQRYPQVIASAHLNKRTDLAKVEGLEKLQADVLESFAGKGRVNMRFSGTEPNLLRAMVEGGPTTTMDQVINHALALCNLVAQAAESPNPHIDMVDCATGAPIELKK